MRLLRKGRDISPFNLAKSLSTSTASPLSLVNFSPLSPQSPPPPLVLTGWGTERRRTHSGKGAALIFRRARTMLALVRSRGLGHAPAVLGLAPAAASCLPRDAGACGACSPSPLCSCGGAHRGGRGCRDGASATGAGAGPAAEAAAAPVAPSSRAWGQYSADGRGGRHRCGGPLSSFALRGYRATPAASAWPAEDAAPPVSDPPPARTAADRLLDKLLGNTYEAPFGYWSPDKQRVGLLAVKVRGAAIERAGERGADAGSSPLLIYPPPPPSPLPHRHFPPGRHELRLGCPRRAPPAHRALDRRVRGVREGGGLRGRHRRGERPSHRLRHLLRCAFSPSHNPQPNSGRP